VGARQNERSAVNGTRGGPAMVQQRANRQNRPSPLPRLMPSERRHMSSASSPRFQSLARAPSQFACLLACRAEEVRPARITIELADDGLARLSQG
jgi:hypothetical protein